MKKRIQNKVAESKLSLPVMLIYTTGIWMAGGLIQHQWWIQFGCLMLTTFLMVQMSTINLLIRIFSRMVSCSFLALTCCAVFLFPSLTNSILQLCWVGFLNFLLLTYQDKQATGFTYYAFLLLGIASLVFVQIVYLIPIIWLLMATMTQSLSWRTWGASLLGLLTPYWIGMCWLVWNKDFTPLSDHITQLADYRVPTSDMALNNNQIAFLVLLVVLSVIGIIHYLRQKHNDKIRNRLIYGFIIWIEIATGLFLILQPQHYNYLISIMIIHTAPLIAHFIALTYTKVTNITFYAIALVTFILTCYNLWTF